MYKNSWDIPEDLDKVLELNSKCCVEELLPDLVHLNFEDTTLVRKTITTLGYLIVTYYCGENYKELNKVFDWLDKIAQSCDNLRNCILYVCLDKANFLIAENDSQYAYSLINIVINDSRADSFSQRILKPLNLSEKTNNAYQLIEWCIQFGENLEGEEEDFYATGILEKALSFAEGNLDTSDIHDIYYDRFWMMQCRISWPNSTFEDTFSCIETMCKSNNEIDRFPQGEYERTIIILKKMIDEAHSHPTRKHETTLLCRTMGLAMARRTLSFPHQSIEMLISHLELLKIKEMHGFIVFLSKKKLSGKIVYDKIKSFFCDYIQLLITDTKRTKNNRCDIIKWYLNVFRMTPDTVLQDEEFGGYSVLMLACQFKANFEILKMFVEHLDGNVNFIAETHYSGIITPLLVACEYKNLAAVKYLLSKEADPNGNKVCMPALHLCLEENYDTITDFLLEQSDVDVNKVHLGKYPIHHAAKYADVRTVMKLVNRGALPDQESSLGETPLHLALLENNDAKCNIARYLLLVCKVRKNLLLKGESPLFMAARTGQIVALEIIINNEVYTDPVIESGNYKGYTPLTIAIKQCHEMAVAILLKHFNLDANRQLKLPKTNRLLSVFQYAQVCQSIDNNNGRKNILGMLADNWIRNHPEQVRNHIYELLNDNTYTDLENWQNFILSQDSIDPQTGDTVVHYLCRKKATKTLAWALKVLKLNPDQPNFEGNTGLHIACRNKSLALLELLLKYPHTINHCNKKGLTPMDIALSRNSPACVKLLLDHGAIKSNDTPNKAAYILSTVITKEIIEETICISRAVEAKVAVAVSDNDKVGKNPKPAIIKHPTRVSIKQVKTEQIKVKLEMNKQARQERTTKPVKSPITVANHPNGLLTQKKPHKQDNFNEHMNTSSPELPDHEDEQWPTYEDNFPLHKITRAVEQTIFNIDRCQLGELDNHLSILANFLLPIQEFRNQGLLARNSPLVAQIQLLYEEIELKLGEPFSHTECQTWKKAILTVYQELIDQSGWMFHLDDPALRKFKILFK